MNPMFPPEFYRTPFQFENPLAEIVPVGAVMRIAGADLDATDGEIVDQIAKPDATARPVYLVNIAHEVPAKVGAVVRRGMASPLTGRRGLAQYDTADGTPVLGEFWSPASGSWQLRKGGSQFVVTGWTTTLPDRVVVMQNLRAPPRRAYFQATDWLSSSELVAFAGGGGIGIFREDDLAEAQPGGTEIKVLRTGTYMLTVNITAYVQFSSPAPTFWGLDMKVSVNGGGGVVQRFALACEVEIASGGSPSHTHVATVRAKQFADGFSSESNTFPLNYRTVASLAVNDIIQVELIPMVSASFITDINPQQGFSYLELEPLF